MNADHERNIVIDAVTKTQEEEIVAKDKPLACNFGIIILGM